MKHLKSQRHLSIFSSKWFLLILFFLSACAGPQKIKINEDRDLESIVILGLNDLQGALAPIPLRGREIPPPPPVQSGGFAVLADYVKKARAAYGNRLLVLDAGDSLTGSLESHLDRGSMLIHAMNLLGVNAAGLGVRDFDLGFPTLRLRLMEAQFPFLASNLRFREPSAGLPNLSSHLIFDVGPVKVGVFSLITEKANILFRPESKTELSILDLRESALKEIKALKSQGADLIVLLAHAGIQCPQSKKTATRTHDAGSLRIKKQHPRYESCLRSGELAQLLESLPENSVHAVVSGSSHAITHHWVKGIPVIQSNPHAQNFNLIRLSYDLKRKKLRPELTEIEGPIPVCYEIYSKQKDCDPTRVLSRQGRGGLERAEFLGSRIGKESSMEDLIEPLLSQSQKEGSRKVGTAAVELDMDPAHESLLGNYVADVLRAKTKADFALVNPGLLRAEIPEGEITYDTVFRALPVDHSIAVLNVTGDELKKILQIATAGPRGFASVSGLKLKLISLKYPARATDLNLDGHKEPWELDRLLSVRLMDDSRLKDRKIYTLATTDFLASGGDDLNWILSKLPASRVSFLNELSVRQAVLDDLQKSKANPSFSRLSLTTPPATGGRKKRK